MARMHILQQVSPNLYDVVVHVPTPAGNNAAGFAWSAVVAAAQSSRDKDGVVIAPASSMITGTGPGQIDAAEAAQIAAGTVIETRFQWGDERGWNNTQRLADLNLRAQQAVDETLAIYAERFRQFGRTVA